MDLGRNDPCHCGSGKKYKKCHLPRETSLARAMERGRRPLPPDVARRLNEHLIAVERKRDEHHSRFGAVREIVHADFQGDKFVAVGGELFWSQKWRTFPDFLFDYIKNVLPRHLGADWGPRELAKPLGSRHPILQWYDALCDLQRRTVASIEAPADKLCESELDGPSAAYLSLAYDLFVIADNQRLQKEVVKRLGDPGKFQGARYELTVAATMIRAGFTLDYEDEDDNQHTHPEFLATHRRSGEVVAVEAKSRRRSGVMGWKGPRDRREEFRLGIDDLFRQALKKSVSLPFVIFIDANMPPEIAFEDQNRWLEEINNTLPRVAHGFGTGGIFEGVPFTGLALTNFPHDYGHRGAPDPGKIVFTSQPFPAARPFKTPGVFGDIETALRQYGNVPQEFPSESSSPAA